MSVFIPVVFLVFLTILFKIQAKTWIAPGSMFAGYWSVAVIAPLLLAPSASDYPVTSSSIWWVCLSVLSLGIGSMLGTGSNKKILDVLPESNIKHFSGLKKIVMIFTIIGIFDVFYYVSAIGYGIGVFFSLSTLKELSSSVYASQYTGDSVVLPPLYNILLCFTYAASYLAGMLNSLQKTKVSFLPFIPIILASLIMTQKATIIFPVFLWIAGWLSMRVRLGKIDIPFRFFLRMVYVVIALTVIFVILSMLRYKVYDLAGLSWIYQKLTVYYVGYLSGFSQWFSSSAYTMNSLGLGAYTFAGLFDMIGLHDRTAGIFTEGVRLGAYDTNIFTVFRYLIQDWSLPGSLIYLFFIGLISGNVYKKTLRGSLLALPLLAMFYAQVLFSNTTTVFGYNTMIFSAVIIFIYIGIKGTDLLNPFKTKKKIVKNGVNV